MSLSLPPRPTRGRQGKGVTKLGRRGTIIIIFPSLGWQIVQNLHKKEQMGGCQPSKLHIDNAGNMRTANDIQYPSLRSSGDSFEIRAPQDVNQRSRMHNFQGQGDPMKIESEAYQLNLEDLDESPQTSETSAQTNFPRDHMKPVSACYTGKVKNSLYVSKKGRKVYESSYPKISA